MPVPGDIGREHADLTVGDLAGRARVLAPHPAGGPPLLEKAGLVYDQHRTRIGQGLKGIVAHQIAQRLGVPLSPAEQRLLAPRCRITRRLRPHPARLAPLRPKERISGTTPQNAPCALAGTAARSAPSRPATTTPTAPASPRPTHPSSMIHESW